MSKKVKAPGQRTHWQMVAHDLKVNRTIYLLAIPMIVYYIVFKYVPMYGVTLAFKEYKFLDGILGSPWADPWYKWFKQFVTGRWFVVTVKNTFLLSLLDFIFGFPAPIIFALLLNEIRSTPFRRTVQTITYMPHFISVVVVCGMLVQFCSTKGLFNSILTFFTGKEGKNLLMQSGWFRPIYIGSGIWKGIGWNSILYIAAIHGIDQSQYEAAKIDGAGRFAQAIFITIPCMAPTIIIKLIFRMGDMMSIGFEKVFLLQNDATLQVSEVISTYTYKTGLKGMKYSLSTAINLFDTVINLVLLLTANALARKFSETSLF